jgi:hypothetical protein
MTTYYVVSIETPSGAEARQFNDTAEVWLWLTARPQVKVLRAYTVTK